jgi:hypothetical protein
MRAYMTTILQPFKRCDLDRFLVRSRRSGHGFRSRFSSATLDRLRPRINCITDNLLTSREEGRHRRSHPARMQVSDEGLKV